MGEIELEKGEVWPTTREMHEFAGGLKSNCKWSLAFIFEGCILLR
jgi:hypothetical protein